VVEQPLVVLRVGAGIAVLAHGIGEGRAEHDAVATRLLCAAAGRSDIHVTRRASGRPRLEPPLPELGVSLSWRGGLLLVGFDPRVPVGVDLEPATEADVIDPRRMANDHFSKAEAEALAGVPVAAARELFLRLWVAKEAALKLTGRGIVDGMDEPDLAGHLEALAAGDVIILAGSARLPALQLAVARPQSRGATIAHYCALARQLMPGE
jgi:4'-phosphopantetheinyl transferase